MLADPKADALIKNFAGQWLYLRELANVQTEAKNFDDNLRQSFRRETEMLFGAIVREDRSLIDLLDADYTFVDERLARALRHPERARQLLPPRLAAGGQPAPRAARPRQHADGDLDRHAHVAGLARQMDSREPVRRAAAAAAAGRGNESGRGPTEGKEPTTLRQRLELHRANPACASCHRIMDPLGFSLENFDLVGTWREKDGATPIDSTGQLADGTPLSGPADLRQALLSRSDAFMTTATEKLLTYALGRPVHYYDMPQVRSIAAPGSGERQSVLVGADGHHRERRVSEAASKSQRGEAS